MIWGRRWKIGDPVTDKTKFVDLAPFIEYIQPNTRARLKKAATGKYGDPWGVTIGDMLAVMGGDLSYIGANRYDPVNMTALQYFWVEAFRDMVSDMTAAIKSLEPPTTPEAKAAAQACRSMTFREAAVVFLREYFGLQSFQAAEALHIDDLLLAKKDRYNSAAFEKARADIYARKQKTT